MRRSSPSRQSTRARASGPLAPLRHASGLSAALAVAFALLAGLLGFAHRPLDLAPDGDAPPSLASAFPGPICLAPARDGTGPRHPAHGAPAICDACLITAAPGLLAAAPGLPPAPAPSLPAAATPAALDLPPSPPRTVSARGPPVPSSRA